jgi:septal ring factor EnvC (AmiA/AmiB activator)
VAARQAPKKKPKPPVDPRITRQKTLQQQNKALAKQLTENETKMAGLEAQLAEIEVEFGKPEFYANAAEVKTTMDKHKQLQADIKRLTEEWEKLTLEAEYAQLQLAEIERKG